MSMTLSTDEKRALLRALDKYGLDYSMGHISIRAGSLYVEDCGLLALAAAQRKADGTVLTEVRFSEDGPWPEGLERMKCTIKAHYHVDIGNGAFGLEASIEGHGEGPNQALARRNAWREAMILAIEVPYASPEEAAVEEYEGIFGVVTIERALALAETFLEETPTTVAPEERPASTCACRQAAPAATAQGQTTPFEAWRSSLASIYRDALLEISQSEDVASEYSDACVRALRGAGCTLAGPTLRVVRDWEEVLRRIHASPGTPGSGVAFQIAGRALEAGRLLGPSPSEPPASTTPSSKKRRRAEAGAPPSTTPELLEFADPPPTVSPPPPPVSPPPPPVSPEPPDVSPPPPPVSPPPAADPAGEGEVRVVTTGPDGTTTVEQVPSDPGADRFLLHTERSKLIRVVRGWAEQAGVASDGRDDVCRSYLLALFPPAKSTAELRLSQMRLVVDDPLGADCFRQWMSTGKPR